MVNLGAVNIGASLGSSPADVITVLSYICIGLGIFFWWWGTWALLGRRSVLYNLHSLSVADTLGSMAILVGLFLKIPNQWMLLLLAFIFLMIWNTMLGYVLAFCAGRPDALAAVPSGSTSQLPGDLP